MNSNSENPQVGKDFQEMTRVVMEEYFKCRFEAEKPIDIGNPPKPHRFDLVSEDESIIVECKCHTWTVSGNVPSAKLAVLDEAILYLSKAPKESRKIIAMKVDYSPKRECTLAEYFCDKKGHLLDDIEVWEIRESKESRIIKRGRKDVR